MTRQKLLLLPQILLFSLRRVALDNKWLLRQWQCTIEHRVLLDPMFNFTFIFDDILDSIYCDKIFVFEEHPIAGRDTQPFDEISKVMCNK